MVYALDDLLVQECIIVVWSFDIIIIVLTPNTMLRLIGLLYRHSLSEIGVWISNDKSISGMLLCINFFYPKQPI